MLDTYLHRSEALLLQRLLQLLGSDAVCDQLIHPVGVTPQLVLIKSLLVLALSGVLQLELSCQVGFGGDMCQEVRFVGECGPIWTQEADQGD